MKGPGLPRYAWLSIGAAVSTITLKAIAFRLTGSIGLLSDALESFVNLAGALLALSMLTVAERPEDEDHPYGHNKAEYFASGAEGALIVLTAVSIGFASIRRLIHPHPLEQVGVGIAVTVAASLLNFAVARTLLAAARRHDSITLEANARHLLTDVWTSAGVIVGVAAVSFTGWQWLDPAVALLVAANIVRTGGGIVRQSIGGLMDTPIAATEQEALRRALEPFGAGGIQFHALRTRQSGARRFVSLHVLVPGEWTVRRGHELLESIEAAVRRDIPNVSVLTHLEALEDPASFEDTALDRAPGPADSGGNAAAKKE